MARDFDGVDDSIDCGSAVGLSSHFFAAAWIMPRSVGENELGRIFNRDVTEGTALTFYVGDLHMTGHNAFGVFIRSRLSVGTFFMLDVSGPTYVDDTVDINDADVGDVLLMPATETAGADGVGDTALYGHATIQFGGLLITLSTAGVGGTVAWEYLRNGTTWVDMALLDFVDNTIGYTAGVGTYSVSWGVSRLEGWSLASINGVSRFWVRSRVTGLYSTNPVATQAFLLHGAEAVSFGDTILMDERQFIAVQGPAAEGEYPTLYWGNQRQAAREVSYATRIALQGTFPTPTTNFTIGTNKAASPNYTFDGVIARPYWIEGITLTLTEIQCLQYGLLSVPWGGRVGGYWLLTGASPELDSSGNGNSGTVSGSLHVPDPPILLPVTSIVVPTRPVHLLEVAI